MKGLFWKRKRIKDGPDCVEDALYMKNEMPDYIIINNDLIAKLLTQLRDNGYTPFALWLSKNNATFVITTTNYDLSKEYELIKKY